MAVLGRSQATERGKELAHFDVTAAERAASAPGSHRELSFAGESDNPAVVGGTHWVRDPLQLGGPGSAIGKEIRHCQRAKTPGLRKPSAAPKRGIILARVRS